MIQEIKDWFTHENVLTVDVVPHDGSDEFTVTFTDVDTAIADIETLAFCNDVFF